MSFPRLRITLAVFSFSFSFYACTSFDSSTIDNLNDNQVQKIGHAGLGFSSWIPFNPYPSNSFVSLSKALVEYEADGIETDIHMTADGHFVLYHDEKIDSKTLKSGCIETMNYTEVLQIEYSLGFPFDLFHSEKLIGLETLISFMKTQGEFPFLHLDLRCKSACFTAEEDGEWEKKFLDQLIVTLTKLEVPKEKVLLISLSKPQLDYARQVNCPFPLSLEEVGSFELGLKEALRLDIEYLTIKPKLITREQTKLAHKAGVKIVTFGAKSKAGNKALLELNPDVIQTNNLKALNELLE